MPNLLKMYERTLSLPYERVDPYNVEYHIKRVGNTLYIDFKWTNSKTKWLLNFQWYKKPYKDMKSNWSAHVGFLKCWKTVEPYIAVAIGDFKINKIRVVGYSHGGALAMMCHEFIWFHRPDLREELCTYAFGAPKVFFGRIQESLKERWEKFTVIKIDSDIVSKLPPFYTHVGKILTLECGVKSLIKSHHRDCYIYALTILE